jgi:DUF2075 family protein
MKYSCRKRPAYVYVDILWLNDLIWRDSGWQVNTASVHESGITNLVCRARRETSLGDHAHSELLQRVTQAYHIVLTRPLKGAYLCVPDNDTRGCTEASLGAQ